MLRNLEKKVIFRAIITKKRLHKSKEKKKRFRISLSAQGIVQIFGRFKDVRAKIFLSIEFFYIFTAGR